MSIHNQKRKKYSLNDNYFQSRTLQSHYFAGLIASDGYLSRTGNAVVLGLQRKDKDLIKLFKQELQASNPIKDVIEKGKFEASKFEIASYQIRQDLQDFYNITPGKSLTLQPPNLTNTEHIDAFIVGYIDGDGSIFLQTPLKNRNPVLSISILGTFEMLSWVQTRIRVVLGVDKAGCLRRKRNNDKNTFTLTFSNTLARRIFLHYYNVNVEKLERKWSMECYNHSINFKNKRHA